MAIQDILKQGYNFLTGLTNTGDPNKDRARSTALLSAAAKGLQAAGGGEKTVTGLGQMLQAGLGGYAAEEQRQSQERMNASEIAKNMAQAAYHNAQAKANPDERKNWSPERKLAEDMADLILAGTKATEQDRNTLARQLIIYFAQNKDREVIVDPLTGGAYILDESKTPIGYIKFDDSGVPVFQDFKGGKDAMEGQLGGNPGVLMKFADYFRTQIGSDSTEEESESPTNEGTDKKKTPAKAAGSNEVPEEDDTSGTWEDYVPPSTIEEEVIPGVPGPTAKNPFSIYGLSTTGPNPNQSGLQRFFGPGLGGAIQNFLTPSASQPRFPGATGSY